MKPDKSPINKNPHNPSASPLKKGLDNGVEAALSSRLSNVGKGRNPASKINGRLSNTGAGGRELKPTIAGPIRAGQIGAGPIRAGQIGAGPIRAGQIGASPTVSVVTMPRIPSRQVGSSAPLTPTILNLPHVKRVVEFIVSKHGQPIVESDFESVDVELLERVASVMIEYSPIIGDKLDKVWLKGLYGFLRSKKSSPSQIVEDIIIIVENLRNRNV